MGATDFLDITETKLKRIAWLSGRDEHKQFNRLMHYFNEASLRACFRLLKGKKAVGTDSVTKEVYGENRDSHLKDRVERMKRMAYRPEAVRETRIAKAGKPGATRALGISNFEDKGVQKRMQQVLESIV